MNEDQFAEPLTQEARFDSAGVLSPDGVAEPALPSSQVRKGGRFRSMIRPFTWAWILQSLLRPQWLLLVLVAVAISHGITKGEPSFANDETRHAMNGVFMRDLLVDMPLRHPMQYSYEYYSKYPAVALPHWPPFFSVVEGAFFLVFGISTWVGRLAILAFSLLGAYFWYRIAEEHGPRYLAFFSALIFALLPAVLLFEDVIMLEIPQMAMCMGAAFFWLRFLRSERASYLWAAAAFSVGALLTSQLAIFLVVFFGLHFLVERRFRLLRRWDVWIALVTSFGVVLSWYRLSFGTLSFSYQRGVGHGIGRLLTWHNISWYFRVLPQQLGLVLLCLSVVGLGWAVFKSARRYRFLLLWVAASYLCFTLIAEKEPRHIMIWIPPLVYFALVGIEVLLRRPRWVLILSVAIASYFFVTALRYVRPTAIGVEAAARYVMAQPESDIVYYQGALNGDFIFFVRKLDPEKSHMIVREKEVVVSNVDYVRRQVLDTTEATQNLFRTWGIRYALIEDGPFLTGLDPVQKLVHSDQFELVKIFPIWSNDNNVNWRTVSLYRYRGNIDRTKRPVVIPMLTIRHDIPVDLSRLAGRPWPN
jgi:4-amino-4-deoxy-L-arabinose transferase-like glycosyltransferase